MLLPVLVLAFIFSAQAVWQPRPGTTWQWQLAGKLDLSLRVQMYDVDMEETNENEIRYLKGRGIKVICYFSAGTYEPYRSDSRRFSSHTLGKSLPEWKDERWLDYRHSSVKDIMKKRMEMAKRKGCDGVEPDNVDGYANNNGHGLSSSDQLKYNKWLATEAHSLGLSVGLKNDVDQLKELEPYFDWALNEECEAYDECGEYKYFLSKGKAVFHTEYVDDHGDSYSHVCKSRDIPRGFSTIVKDWDLTAWRKTC